MKGHPRRSNPRPPAPCAFNLGARTDRPRDIGALRYASLAVGFLAALAAFPNSVTAQAGPDCAIVLQSRLADLGGGPLEGPVDVTLTFYEGGGPLSTPLDCRRFSDASIDEGWLVVTLDACVTPPEPVDGCGMTSISELLERTSAAGEELYLGIRLDDDATDATPRTQVGAVPFAVIARSARTFGGEPPEAFARVGALAPIATSGSYDDLSDVPGELADGDDDSLGALRCLDAQVPVFDDEVDAWVCGEGTDFGGVPVGSIVMWSGAVEDIPSGWALCDGTVGTPDLRDRFVVGAGARAVGDTGEAEASFDISTARARNDLVGSFYEPFVTGLSATDVTPRHIALAFIMRLE